MALILPAFETYDTQLRLPDTKEELSKLISVGSLAPFREAVWSAGHRATNYSRWYSAVHPYQVRITAIKHYNCTHLVIFLHFTIAGRMGS